MKFASQHGRAVLVLDDRVADLDTVSEGRFGPDPMALFHDWPEVVAFARTVTETTGPLEPAALDAPVPRPTQVFGIGLNYRDHAEEMGMPLPEYPITFTKFPTSITGPDATVSLAADTVDWEVELVVVIGTTAHHVTEADAWDHVAGLTVGQDLSDRVLQMKPGGQFSLGKSRPGYAPIGPWIVTPDEVADRNDLALRCSIDGEVVQDGCTSDLIHPVASLIAQLSAVLPLLPGDLIFTGTPAGVGSGRTPPRFLRPGEVLSTTIDGVGSIRTTFTA